MTVIWGLDLKEMQWGKFKSSYMFGNTDYHLRRTKFVVYQLAMIFCVISESLGTAALSDYIDQQKYLVRQNKQAIEYNDDYVGIGSYNIWCGIFVAFIFGAAFFFDLFWPERHESRSVRLAWRTCAVLSCIFVLASAIAMTVILTTHTAYIKNVDQATADQLLSGFPKSGSPLDYRKNGRAIASLVFLWPGWIFTVIRYVSFAPSPSGPIRSDQIRFARPLTSHPQHRRAFHVVQAR